MAVVHLKDLDVELGSKRLGDARGQQREQVDAEAHIAGLDDGGMTGGGFDLGLIRVRQAGRADDMHDAGLRRKRREGCGRGRRGEIEHALDAGEHGQRIVGDGDAERLEPSHLADVAADCRRALDLDAAGDGAARRRRDHTGQRLAHASRCPEHGQSHVAHCQCPSGDTVAMLTMIEGPLNTHATFYDATAPRHKPRDAER